MHALQVQINEINQKVDRLWEVVRQLGKQVAVTSPQEGAAMLNLPDVPLPEGLSTPMHPPLPSLTEHKDIIDDEYIDSSFASLRGDPVVTEDIQIRRLTAQLTAAYNRIAALEEQLMAQRAKN